MASNTPTTVDTVAVTPEGYERDEKKAVADVSSQPVEQDEPNTQHNDFPLAWKLTALTCGIMLSWGSSFSENILGPLKSTLKKELDINNAQYGTISSATSLVNTILPVLGGYGLDYYGVEWGSLACSIVIFLGAVVSAAGSNQDSFDLVVGGRVLMGFGSTVVESCTSKILAHWFQHRGLGLVYGLDLAVGKLIVLIAKATAIPMRDATSFWGWALWIPAFVCLANLLQNVFYVWWAWSRPEWTHMPTGRRLASDKKRLQALQTEAGEEVAVVDDRAKGSRLRRYAIGLLPDWRCLVRVPRFFWLVVCSQTLQAGVVGSFSSLSADMITVTRGSTAQLAGYTSAVQQVIPVICAPLVGGFFDLFGFRMFFVSLTSGIWILVYCLVGYTHVNALGAMVVASLASAMNALPFLASIPLMVPSQVELGLVLGIWKAFNNSGSVVVDMVAGRLQDITPGNTYERVVGFFVALKALEFGLGLFYGVLDRRFLGGILTISEKKRMVLEKAGQLEDPIGRKPAKVFSAVGITVMCCLIVVAWVLFIRYSL